MIKTFFSIPAIALAALVTTQTFAESASISPHRAIVDAKNRIVTFTVSNPSEIDTTYSIKLIDRQQTEDSSTKLTDDYPFSAKKHLKLSPRKKIRLKAGQSKDIRLKAKNYTQLADGEYRSYLKVTPETVPTPGKQFSIATSMEIPVIIRKGEIDSQVTIKGHFNKNSLNYEFIKSGQRSFFGDLIVTQDNKQVYKASSFAIYPETTKISKKINAELNPNKPITVHLKEDKKSGDLFVTQEIKPK